MRWAAQLRAEDVLRGGAMPLPRRDAVAAARCVAAARDDLPSADRESSRCTLWWSRRLLSGHNVHLMGRGAGAHHRTQRAASSLNFGSSFLSLRILSSAFVPCT